MACFVPFSPLTKQPGFPFDQKNRAGVYTNIPKNIDRKGDNLPVHKNCEILSTVIIF